MADKNIIQAIDRLAKESGSYKAAAKYLGVSPTYLSDIKNGRRDCSESMASRLGFRRITTFRQTKGGSAGK